MNSVVIVDDLDQRVRNQYEVVRRRESSIQQSEKLLNEARHQLLLAQIALGRLALTKREQLRTLHGGANQAKRAFGTWRKGLGIEAFSKTDQYVRDLMLVADWWDSIDEDIQSSFGSKTLYQIVRWIKEERARAHGFISHDQVVAFVSPACDPSSESPGAIDFIGTRKIKGRYYLVATDGVITASARDKWAWGHHVVTRGHEAGFEDLKSRKGDLRRGPPPPKDGRMDFERESFPNAIAAAKRFLKENGLPKRMVSNAKFVWFIWPRRGWLRVDLERC